MDSHADAAEHFAPEDEVEDLVVVELHALQREARQKGFGRTVEMFRQPTIRIADFADDAFARLRVQCRTLREELVIGGIKSHKAISLERGHLDGHAFA